MASAVGSASAIGLVALVGAVSALAIRTEFLPAWLARGGVVIGVLWLTSYTTPSTSRSREGAQVRRDQGAIKDRRVLPGGEFCPVEAAGVRA